MDFERWKLFLLVNEMGSLSKAAVVLNRPQPIISRHINALEAQCGCSLFYRTGRGVALTEVGESILPRVQSMIAEAEQIMLDIKGQAGVPVGRVSIGMLPSLKISAGFVAQAKTLYPEVELHLTEASGGQLAEQVATGRIDLAFVLREPGTVSSTEEALLRLPLCLAGPPDDELTGQAKVPFAALKGLPLIMAKPPNPLRMLVELTARRQDVPLTFSTQVDPLMTQKALVRAGMGWTVTSRMAVRDEVASGQINAANLGDPDMELLLVLVRSNQRPATLAIRKIARLLSDIARQLPDRHAEDAVPAYLPI